MDHNWYCLTEGTAMLAHWLAMTPEHLQIVARAGRWAVVHDGIDYRLGTFGMGRN
jgi:hypothetical protein